MSCDGPSKPDSPDTATRLLRAASDLVGGDEKLAQRLNMSHLLLKKFMSGSIELPPLILLRTVDLLLEERETQLPLVDGACLPTCERSDASDLSA